MCLCTWAIGLGTSNMYEIGGVGCESRPQPRPFTRNNGDKRILAGKEDFLSASIMDRVLPDFFMGVRKKNPSGDHA